MLKTPLRGFTGDREMLVTRCQGCACIVPPSIRKCIILMQSPASAESFPPTAWLMIEYVSHHEPDHGMLWVY